MAMWNGLVCLFYGCLSCCVCALADVDIPAGIFSTMHANNWPMQIIQIDLEIESQSNCNTWCISLLPSTITHNLAQGQQQQQPTLAANAHLCMHVGKLYFGNAPPASPHLAFSGLVFRSSVPDTVHVIILSLLANIVFQVSPLHPIFNPIQRNRTLLKIGLK